MKVKKKNIIWLCANVAVFALFVFFFRVKFVAAAAVVYSAASIGFLTFDLCRGRTESLWCAPMVPIALMVFETEVNNPIDSFGAMLCVSVIIATVLTITAFLVCKKRFAGFSVGGLRQELFLLLAALAIMGCAMTLNNTFTRGAHNVSAAEKGRGSRCVDRPAQEALRQGEGRRHCRGQGGDRTFRRANLLACRITRREYAGAFKYQCHKRNTFG